MLDIDFLRLFFYSSSRPSEQLDDLSIVINLLYWLLQSRYVLQCTDGASTSSSCVGKATQQSSGLHFLLKADTSARAFDYISAGADLSARIHESSDTIGAEASLIAQQKVFAER